MKAIVVIKDKKSTVPKKYEQKINEIIKLKNIKYAKHETYTLPINQKEDLIIIFLKKDAKYTIFGKINKTIRSLKQKYEEFEIHISNLEEAKIKEELLYEVIKLGLYTYKNNKETTPKHKIITQNLKQNTKKRIDVLLKNITSARNLINLSPSYKSTKQIAETLINEFKGFKHTSIKIMDFKEIKKNNLSLIEAVGKGNKEEGTYFLIIEYTPNKKEKFVGLVGKGVIYDSGGYNLKRSLIEVMKLDMGGAIAAAYTLKSLIELGVKKNIVVAIPLVKNLISDKSYLPGDVIIGYNGKGVEIKNTDAEGRLILADALAYLEKNYNLKEIIDIATLTGACMVALGKDIAGIMGTNKKGIKNLIKLGEELEERYWELPIFEEYFGELMSSKIADISNIAPSPWAGAIQGAIFLKKFIKNSPWIHIDIAGPAYSDNGNNIYDIGATGFGIRTLTRYLGSENQ